MKLFEDIERTRLEPKVPGEDDYAFYNSCARPAYSEYRGRLNEWLAEMPEHAQRELIGRFRKNKTFEYQSALAELIVHAALKRQSYVVEIHPEIGETGRKPDFLVKAEDGGTIAYVEVTTFGPPREFVGKRRRAADIYNGIDKTKLPIGSRLGLNIVKHGAKTPSLKTLRRKIEAWTHGLQIIDQNVPPSRLFEIDDWIIEIIVFGGFREDIVSTHAIATAMDDLRIINAETSIRQALSIKDDRYGALDKAYLIVVADCKEELLGGNHNDNALVDAAFGTVVAQSRMLEDGQYEFTDVRRDNGYWGRPAVPRHQNVSGILLLPKPDLWSLREDRWQPLHLRNPWAEKSLPENFFPLPGFAVDSNGQVTKTGGTSLAEILILPAIWPPAG